MLDEEFLIASNSIDLIEDLFFQLGRLQHQQYDASL
jgi:hypothetical protein